MCMDNGLCMYTTDNLTSVYTIDLGEHVCTVCIVYIQKDVFEWVHL